MRSAAVTLTLAAVAAVSLTCGDATGPSVVSVTVAGPDTLFLGDSSRFTAAALASNGVDLGAETCTWVSTNPLVATVDPTGMVRTLAVGNARIDATVRGRTGSRQLHVAAIPTVAVVVTPAVDSVLLGDSLQLTAVALNNNGLPVPGRLVTWFSPDTSRATVSATGVVRARRVEGFVIHAMIDGKRGGAFLKGQERLAVIGLPDTAVVERTQQVAFVPDLRGASGTPITGRLLDWTVENFTAGSVSTPAMIGVVNTFKAATTKLIAGCCGLADTTILIIRPRPAQLIDIGWTSSAAFVAGQSVIATADVRNADAVVEEVPVTWYSSDTTIMAVVPDSVGSRRATLQCRRPGTVLLRATADSLSDSVTVRVDLPITRLTIEPDTLSLISGWQRSVHAVFRDSAGGFHGDASSLWRTLDTTIATVHNGATAIPAVIGKSPGTTGVIARTMIGSTVYEDSTVLVVRPTATPRFYWNVTEQFVDAYVAFAMTLALTDSAGNALPAGKAVTLTAADTGITLSPATIPALNGSTTIQVTGRADGRFTVTARTDSLSTTFLLQVVRHRVDSLRLTAPAVLDVGDSVAVTSQAFGGPGVQSYPRTWSVSDAALASVSAAGVLRGLGPGRVAVTARSFEGVHSVLVTIRSTGGPAIDTAAAAPIVAGTSATIPGTGFAPNPADNLVLIEGVPAPVTAATPTTLTVQVPPATRFTCGPLRPAMVSVATPAGLDAQTLDLVTALSVTLPVGGTAYVNDGRAVCLDIAPAGGFSEYNIAIVHTAPSADASTPLTVTGLASGVAALANQEVSIPAPQRDFSGVPGLTRVRANAQLHRRVLAENRRFAASVGPPTPHLRTMLRPLSSLNDSINDVVQIHVPQIDRPDFCVNHSAIRARRVYSGTRVVIYEDVASVLAGQMDGDLAALGAEFDVVMYPLLRANFGNPLVLDSLLDHNARIAMVLSPLVTATGAAGFVVTCDFYPESVAPSSNVGEMFYAFAPTSSAPFFAPGTRQEWNWLIRSVVMHEAKHITALAERLARGGPIEEGWLEEGSAVLAEELWSRGIYGTTWKSNGRYNQTIFCDVRPFDCGGKPYSMFNAFAFLYDYADGYTSPPGNETRTPLGPTDFTDGSFYGSAWLWLRWIVDHYASSESAFLTTMTQDVTRLGVQHFDALSPQGWPRLITEWALANQLDDNPIATRPEQQHLSWNLPDIFTGMNYDFPTVFTHPYPFRMRTVGFGSFSQSVSTLRGGTAAVLRMQGVQTQPQLLEIRDPGGGTPAIHVQMIRVR